MNARWGKGTVLCHKNEPNNFFLKKLTSANGNEIDYDPPDLFKEGSPRKVHYFKLTKAPLELARLINDNSFLNFCERINNLIPVEIKGRLPKVIFPLNSKNKYEIIALNYPLQGSDIWQFFIVESSPPHKKRIFAIITNYVENLFNRVRNVLALDYLKNKKVAVIGLGAIGSSVAIELAMSGVGNFYLFDSDIISIGNVCGSEYNYFEIGYSKVDILEKKLLLKNPFLKTFRGFNFQVQQVCEL